jgi:hypothetical protein
MRTVNETARKLETQRKKENPRTKTELPFRTSLYSTGELRKERKPADDEGKRRRVAVHM